MPTAPAEKHQILNNIQEDLDRLGITNSIRTRVHAALCNLSAGVDITEEDYLSILHEVKSFCQESDIVY